MIWRRHFKMVRNEKTLFIAKGEKTRTRNIQILLYRNVFSIRKTFLNKIRKKMCTIHYYEIITKHSRDTCHTDNEK